MHIMLVNDDGIHAPGIQTLCRAAREAGHQVSVCAPDGERSAISHAITLSRLLNVVETEMEGAELALKVDGTPADCASLGLYLIPQVDMVISGINNGPNLGGAAVYSGTIAAAMEASMSGVPALAVSLCEWGWEDYLPAARVALRVAEWAREHPLPKGAVYSLNVPALPYGEIRGVRPAMLSPMFIGKPDFSRVETEAGVRYQFIGGTDEPLDDPSYDTTKVGQGFATLTTLTWNLRLSGPDPDTSGIRL